MALRAIIADMHVQFSPAGCALSCKNYRSRQPPPEGCCLAQKEHQLLLIWAPGPGVEPGSRGHKADALPLSYPHTHIFQLLQVEKIFSSHCRFFQPTGLALYHLSYRDLAAGGCLSPGPLAMAMNHLAEKTGHKILLFSNKFMLGRYCTVVQVCMGVDWSQVHIYSALLSEQSLKCLVKQWGNDRWQAKWAGLSTCQQTKIWFPFIRCNFIPKIRQVDRYNLGHLIHFTIGQNFLLRHR